MYPDPSHHPARRPPTADRLSHAEFHLREDGAAAVRSGFEHGERCWHCIVHDTDEWRYVGVRGLDLGPSPNLCAEDVEQGVERFAATLPVQQRRRRFNPDPLHVDRDGPVRD
jgi:hypothetical protein